MAPALLVTETSGNVCTTPACLQISSYMLSSMAPNYTEIDPCTDFEK
ncbi:hypothetical protein CTA2_1350, partial [Colletotrichum tanaceti]